MKVLYEFSGYHIIERLPTVSEFLAVARQLNRTAYLDDTLINNALEHSLYGVIAVSREQVIGMGRIVGDNATLFVIQDVMVIPSCAGMGIEIAMLDALLIHLENHAPDHAVVASLPSIHNIAFYEQVGFKRTAPQAFGMFRVIDRDNPDQEQIPWK